ncbi:MAG: MlaD family protein [Minwuia sp.]|uniref:MlaD family protein n=1 Tax=Minwuia sp. TaxID=2493630 RepID=UPI003A83A9FF
MAAGLFPRTAGARRAGGEGGLTLETRASHILIGSVVLIITFAFFGFAIWLAQIDLDSETRLYQIHFEGSVAGLGVGGDVRYRGIRIGSVTDIGLDPEDPSKALTVVEVDGKTPIREGDVATLKPQGITGVVFVNIEGAEAGAKPLREISDERIPVIPSKKGDIEILFASAPELLDKAIRVTDNLARILGPENQQSIQGILADLKTLTGTISGQKASIDNVLKSLESSAADIAATMQEARKVVGRVDVVLDDASETLAVGRGALAGIDQMVTRDGGAMLGELKQASADLAAVTGALARIVENNEGDLDSFANDGLWEFRRFINEGRLLIASISRLTERLESGGAQSLLGVQGSEVERDK